MDNIDEVIDLKYPTDTAFNNESISTEHVKQENNISEDNIKESSDNKFELSKKVQKKVHKCAICDYQTPHSSRFFRHKNIHLTREERQLFPCTQCDNKYSTTQSLKYHLRNNHIDSRAKELNKSQKKIYKCSTCSYQARDMSVLRRHKVVHLAPEERQWFACTHCEKKYILKINLEHHIEDNHNYSRSEDALKNIHKCSICGYQTRLMSSFERHQKTHLAREERQMFPCPHCDKKYVSKGSLESHLGNNHIDSRSEDAQKTILRCSICGYQTIRSARFEKHQKIHLAPVDREMFTCAHCDKPYISKQGLKHHIEDNHIDSRKKKSQGKVYKCAICDYETLCLSNLGRHNNVHLAPEERQMFACELCDKKCRSKKGLQYHLKNAHVDFRNADCISTDEVILDSLKIEMDELTSLLDDTKSSQRISATNEIKSEDFIKTEPDDVTPILIKDMHDDFKNIEYVAKIEDFIKMEPDDDVLFLDKDTHF